MECSNRPVMVCLISRQTMQNLLPILQCQPQRVVCVTTREEDTSRKHLEAVLQARQIAVEPPVYVDAYDPHVTLQACQHILERYGAEALLVNVTGGTKVMSLAAFRAFSAAHVPCCYTDTPHRRLLFLHPDDQAAVPLSTTVDVLTYLQAHGQRASLRGRDSRLSLPGLAAFIGVHIATLEPFLSRLRYEMHDTTDRRSVRFSLHNKRQRHATAEELLLQAQRAGVLEARQSGPRELEIVFRDDKARRYLEGDWLEDLVFETVQQTGFDSYASNVALAWQDAPEREMNEIDVAVVHNLRFFYISCRTRSTPEEMKHHLYELETLAEMVGGLFNHPILVASSAKGVPVALRRRMETLGIAYVGPEDLPHLATRLKHIMK